MMENPEDMLLLNMNVRMIWLRLIDAPMVEKLMADEYSLTLKGDGPSRVGDRVDLVVG
jgi:hypothetical protein